MLNDPVLFTIMGVLIDYYVLQTNKIIRWMYVYYGDL